LRYSPEVERVAGIEWLHSRPPVASQRRTSHTGFANPDCNCVVAYPESSAPI